MNDFTVQVAKLAGTPDSISWSQVHFFIPQDEEKLKQKGILMAVLNFSDQNKSADYEIAAYGKEIISRLHEQYYGQLEKSARLCLNQSIQKISSEFNNKDFCLGITAGVLTGKTLYLAILGKGQIYLKRNEDLQPLLRGNEEIIENAGGILEINDAVIFCSERFIEILPEGALKAGLANNNLEGAIESFAPLVLGQPQTAQASCLLARLDPIKENPVVIENKVNLFSKLPNVRISLPPINPENPLFKFLKDRKMLFSVAIILIFMLLASAVLGLSKRGSADKNQKFQEISGQINQKIEEGKGLVDLNSSKSKELFLQAQQLVLQLNDLKINPSETELLNQKVTEALNQVIKEYQIAQAPVFYDIEFIKKGARGRKIIISESNLIVADSQDEQIYVVNAEKKSTVNLIGKNQGGFYQTLAGSQNYVYALNESGLTRFEISTKKGELIVKQDEEWGQIAAIGEFASNLYFLSPDKSLIWRYQFLNPAYSVKQPWLKGEKIPDLSGTISLAIDGSIWVLKANGQIIKLTGGIQESFTLKNLDKSLNSPARIWTDGDSSRIYIFDKGNRRIILFSKNGDYQGQYLYDGLSEVTDFTVSESLKKIFLLKENQILEIELK